MVQAKPHLPRGVALSPVFSKISHELGLQARKSLQSFLTKKEYRLDKSEDFLSFLYAMIKAFISVKRRRDLW